jgi:hypothetical protein
MTEAYQGGRIVYYNSGAVPPLRGCRLTRYATSTRTNWHYECANAFLDGKITATQIPDRSSPEVQRS